MKESASSFLSLFTSVGTLICCALPALFVSLGMGFAVVALVSNVPWLVALSRHKEWVFAASGTLMALSFFLTYGLPRLRRQPDACEASDGSGCKVAGRFTRTTLWISLIIYLFGFFAAYLLLPLRLYLEG